MSNAQEPHYICVNTPFAGGHSPKQIKEAYDRVFKSDEYGLPDEREYPRVYSQLYEHVRSLPKNTKVITVSQDQAVSAATIPALNEKYIIQEGEEFTSNLRIIYIDSKFDFNNSNVFSSYDEKVCSSITGIKTDQIINSKLLVKPDQIFYIGINEDLIDDEQLEIVDQLQIEYYSLQKIKKLGVEKVLKSILSRIEDHPVHVVFDMQALDKSLAPAVVRESNVKEGMSFEDFDVILDKLKSNVLSLDVCGFNDSVDNEEKTASRYTAEIGRYIIRQIFNIKEKSINIFTEESKFLIYRPLQQNAPEDLGWYIARFMSLQEREQIIAVMDPDSVRTISIEDDDGDEIDYLITVTSVGEQQIKSYYTAQAITDCCLFPQEKMQMVFELVNTKTDESTVVNADK
jgi:arginase family enzyme